MLMKDSVKEFEKLNENLNKILEANWFNPLSWFSDKSQESEPNKSYQRSDVINKHLQSIESEEECAPGTSNRRFSSEPGSNSATFYSIKNKKIVQTGFVKDIKPFLDNAGISKKFLRCYDLSKDKLKINWLFNGEFNADILDWDKKKKKVIFQGIWKSGLFGGINYPKQDEKTIESPLEKKYYILDRNQEIGPYTASQILKLKQNWKLSDSSIIRPSDSTDYQYLNKDKTLAFLLKNDYMGTKPVKSTEKPAIKSNPASQL